MSSDDKATATVQHTPVHQRGEVFDPRHPAATPFAVAQPGAGVVSDDAHARGQNLAGGTPESEAAVEYADQREVLVENHERDLRIAAGLEDSPADGQTSPATEKAPTKTAASKTTTK